MNEIVSVQSAKDCARRWLFEDAAPLWLREGVCADGLFAERMTLDGQKITMPRRFRVQARQIYSFVQIGRLGWDGPWRDCANRAIDVVLGRGRRSDGHFIHCFAAADGVSDERADLYDHAFGLFALAHASVALGRPELIGVAHDVMDRLDRWRRVQGGFSEGEIASCPPHRQNPHMHMFEAALALYEASGEARWLDLARELAALCRLYFIDKRSGALTEYFEADWAPLDGAQGGVVEPGHCLEWAWLFDTAGFDGGNDVADRLSEFALKHGLCPDRGVMMNEVDLSGELRDGSARLWPQTERIKSAVRRFARLGGNACAEEVVAATRGLFSYLDTHTAGVWRDKWRQDRSWVQEDAPASSFYHIVCAFGELQASPA